MFVRQRWVRTRFKISDSDDSWFVSIAGEHGQANMILILKEHEETESCNALLKENGRFKAQKSPANRHRVIVSQSVKVFSMACLTDGRGIGHDFKNQRYTTWVRVCPDFYSGHVLVFVLVNWQLSSDCGPKVLLHIASFEWFGWGGLIAVGECLGSFVSQAKNVSHEMEIWKQLIETELKSDPET